MLPPTPCEAEAVSWIAMMGTIRSRRFVDIARSKNVSWRVRRRDIRSVGAAIVVLRSAMLSRNGKNVRSRSSAECFGLVVRTRRSVKGLAEVSSGKSMR